MRKLISISFITAALALSACTSIEERPATAKFVTQYAVLKFADEVSDVSRADRIAKVAELAAQVKELSAAESVSVGLLRTAVNTEIAKLQLSPADLLLANALADIVAEELLLRVGDGVLSPTQQLQVAQVMDWIVEAAAMATPPAS